ncbi:TPA: hypothetical protein ACGF30_003298 [Vibrio cholerae]|nr:hypothetical protein [Vibrio cholerae]EKG0005800.1 hypothetical protein [Vibrio cholerae]
MTVDQVVLRVSESISLFIVLPYLAIFIVGFLLGIFKGHTIGLSFAFLLVLSIYFGIELLPVSLLSLGIYNFGSLISTKWLGKDAGIANFALSLSVVSFPFMVIPTLKHFFELQSNSLYSSYILVYVIIFIFAVSTLWKLQSTEWKAVSLRVSEYKGIVDRDANVLTYVILCILACILNYTLVPVLNYDDLATHYYIQNQFSLGNLPSFDVSIHVWAVSQWLFDLYYGFFDYFFIGKGRTIVNGLMFLGISFISFIILRRKFSANISLLVILVGVSSPLVILALTTSQTELVTLFIAISITYLWIDWKKGNFFASIPVFAFAVAIKPSNAVIFILPFLMFIFRYLRQSGLKEIFMLKNLCVIVFSVFLAFYPYFFAYYHAGNPFFPLFNSLFAAPFYPASDFFNTTYTGNFGFTAFWGLLFETSRFLESSNGVIGFQLALLPILLVGLLLNMRTNFYLATFVGSIFLGGLMLFYSQQYARYIMPTLYLIPLLSVLCLRGKFVNLVIQILSPFIIFFNIVFAPGVIWYLNEWNNTSGLSSVYQYKYRDSKESIARVNEYLNALPGKVNPVYPHNKPYAANIEDGFVYLNWYNQYNQNKYLRGALGILELIDEKKITHIITNSHSSQDVFYVAKTHGVLVYQDANYNVYEIGASSSSLTISNEISVGSPSRVNDTTFNVDKDNFYVLEYDLDSQIRNLEVKIKLKCGENGLWKNYIEFDRYTNFTNHLTINECNVSDGWVNIEYILIPPKGTKHLRLFLQPMIGQFTVKLEEIIIQ